MNKSDLLKELRIDRDVLGANFTQVVFQFAVTPALVRQGLFIAIAIGMIGGFLPALRAA